MPLGLTHIVLVIRQPVAVGAWCTLCLAAAAAMLITIPFTVDEVVATGQFLRASVREGKPFWRTFLVGDTLAGGGPDERTPRYGAAPLTHAPAVGWGVSLPWTPAASGLLGVWITASPAALDASGAAANNAAVAGLLVLTAAVCSLAEVIRPIRFLNLIFAGWLALTRGSPTVALPHSRGTRSFRPCCSPSLRCRVARFASDMLHGSGALSDASPPVAHRIHP